MRQRYGLVQQLHVHLQELRLPWRHRQQVCRPSSSVDQRSWSQEANLDGCQQYHSADALPKHCHSVLYSSRNQRLWPAGTNAARARRVLAVSCAPPEKDVVVRVRATLVAAAKHFCFNIFRDVGARASGVLGRVGFTAKPSDGEQAVLLPVSVDVGWRALLPSMKARSALRTCGGNS